EAGETWHPHVEKQAARIVRLVVGQEFLCRRVALDAEPGGFKKPSQGFPEISIVVYDENSRLRFFHDAGLRLFAARGRRLLASSATAATSSSWPTGFERCSRYPAARASCRPMAPACAVTAMAGTIASELRARIVRMSA